MPPEIHHPEGNHPPAQQEEGDTWDVTVGTDAYDMPGETRLRRKIGRALARSETLQNPLSVTMKEPVTLRFTRDDAEIQRARGVTHLLVQLVVEGEKLQGLHLLGARRTDDLVSLPPLIEARRPTGNEEPASAAAAASAFFAKLQKTSIPQSSPTKLPAQHAFETEGAPPDVEKAFVKLLKVEQAREHHGENPKGFATTFLKILAHNAPSPDAAPPTVQALAKALSPHHRNTTLRRAVVTFLGHIVDGEITAESLQPSVQACRETARQLLETYLGRAMEYTVGGVLGRTRTVAEGLKKLQETEASNGSRAVQQAGFNMIVDMILPEATRPPVTEQSPEGIQKLAAHDATLLQAMKMARNAPFFMMLTDPQRKTVEQKFAQATGALVKRGKVPVDPGWMDQKAKRQQ